MFALNCHRKGGRSVNFFNTNLNKWFTAPDMIHERKDEHSACALDEKLYVFGGPFETDANFCVEKLDVRKLLDDGPLNVSWIEIRL